MLGRRRPIDTGSTKVGSLIGDHTKTSIGTLLNTGAYVGAMSLIAATGKPLPKYIPSFAWFVRGTLTPGGGRQAMYQAAATAMGRRGQVWTDAQQRMWDAVYDQTSASRELAIQRNARRRVTAKADGTWDWDAGTVGLWDVGHWDGVLFIG